MFYENNLTVVNLSKISKINQDSHKTLRSLNKGRNKGEGPFVAGLNLEFYLLPWVKEFLQNLVILQEGVFTLVKIYAPP
jgi:hypothetical protein